MGTLDLRTLTMLTVVVSLAMAMVLAAHWRTMPGQMPGIREWIGANLLGTVTSLSLIFREEFPYSIGFVLVNIGLVGNALAYYAGTRRFLGLPTGNRWLWLTMLGYTAVICFLTYGFPHGGLRIGANAIMLSVLTGALFSIVQRHGNKDFATRFMLVAVGASFVMSLARLGASIGLPADAVAQSSGVAAAYFAMLYCAAFLVMTVSFLMLSSQRIREELELLASRDPLTGVLNRRAWMDMATREVDRCRRNGDTLCLLALDLDHFKEVNDRYGHQMGDQVLIDFTRRAEAHLRSADRLGRFGGEEFIISLPETGLTAAVAVAERIRQTLLTSTELPPYTVSIGVAEARPSLSLDGMLSDADKALYAAKHKGRNAVCVAGEPTETAAAAG